MSPESKPLFAGWFFLLLIGNCFSQLPSQRPPEQLAPGQNPGSFAFHSKEKVTFTQEQCFPVKVSLQDMIRKAIVELEVKDESPFTLSADLPPGSYRIVAHPISENTSYWPAFAPQLFIDTKGMLTYSFGLDDSLTLKKKVEPLTPVPKSTETVTEAKPLLKWRSLEGTTKYRVNWVVIKPDGKIDREAGGNIQTIATEYRLPREVRPNLRYQWSVAALGPNNEELGNSVCSDFFTPGGKQASAQIKKPVQLQTGHPYFGVIVISSDLEQSPKGILVVGVLAGSPALKAGIAPNDLLTNFNGHALDDVSEEKFPELVREAPIGTQVTIDLLRKNVKKSLQATIEAKP